MKFHQEFSKKDLQRPSVLALVLTNLLPLLGILFFDWKVFSLMLLFWAENVVIGIFNALKMLISGPNSAMNWIPKLFVLPFFCFHYGMFTFVHGVFVLVLFGGAIDRHMDFPTPKLFWETIQENRLSWAIAALAMSHGISFVTNFISRGEYKRTHAIALMIQPYGRIIVLHITILLGGGLMLLLKSPLVGLILLMILKIALDLRGHLAERKKFAEQQGAADLQSTSV